MRSVKLEFTGSGVEFNFNEEVSGVDATVQNSMVFLGTAKGSSIVYTNKGTDLLLKANKGEFINETSAQHIANFAALSTEFFFKILEEDNGTLNDDSLEELNLTLVDFNPQYAEFAVDLTTVGGETINTSSLFNIE